MQFLKFRTLQGTFIELETTSPGLEVPPVVEAVTDEPLDPQEWSDEPTVEIEPVPTRPGEPPPLPPPDRIRCLVCDGERTIGGKVCPYCSGSGWIIPAGEGDLAYRGRDAAALTCTPERERRDTAVDGVPVLAAGGRS